MKDPRFDTIIRAFTDGAVTRRTLGQGLASSVIAAGLAQLGLDSADAKRRGKNRKNKKRKKRRGNNGGGDRDRCRFDICAGECVDFGTDADNCGACGDACIDGLPCVGGRCAFVLGGPGGDAQLFDDPAGIAVNATGFAFVADVNRDRIAVLDDESVLGAIGGTGDQDGRFLRPTGVAANRGTKIFVTDLERHRIQSFDADGRFEGAAGSFGQALGQYDSPHGIAVLNRTARLFVADTGNHSIQELFSNLAAIKRIGRQGDGDGEFNFPKGIAVDRDENLVVADTGNHRIQVVDQNGAKIRAFGRAGDGPGEFNTPIAVAIDSRFSDIFVVDQGNHRVQQFSEEGRFIRAFGRRGAGVGEFENPFGIAIDDRGGGPRRRPGQRPRAVLLPREPGLRKPGPRAPSRLAAVSPTTQGRKAVNSSRFDTLVLAVLPSCRL